MAFAGGVTAQTPFRSQWAAQGVEIDLIVGGTGTTDHEVAAAVASSRHIVVDGSLSSEGTGTVEILSGTTTIATLEFVGAGRVDFPRGLECNTGELMALTNDNGINISGWIAYATITDGQPLVLRGE